MTTTTLRERTAAANRLRALLPAGTTVYTNLRHVSASGMSRIISLHVIDSEAHDIRTINADAATVLGYRVTEVRNSGRGVLVRGTGMDMGFHLVYSLAGALYGDGYALDHRSI